MTAPGDSYDYIVVGGGSAGCILAERLGADGTTKVLVLEAGGPDHSPLIRLPIGVARIWNHPAFNWSYYSEAEPHAGGRRIFHPRGKVLGGSAAINMMAYVRGHAADYDRWAQMGLTEWSYARVLPYFRRIESWHCGADAYRGGDGPIQTQATPTDDPLMEAWLDAGRALGHPLAEDYNGASQDGFARMQFNVGDGRRSNSAARFLRPALRRGNVRLVLGALVERIVFDGSRAVGVDYRAGTVTRRAAARAEVVLAAGAYNSPQILMRSGIGPADHLRALGIAVLADRAGVGANLQDHPASGVGYARLGVGQLQRRLRLDRLVWDMVCALTVRTGPATLPIASGTAFVKSVESLEIPDLQYFFRSYSPELRPWIPVVHPPREDGIGLSFCHLRPEARGSLRLAAPDPTVPPRFVNNFLASEADRAAMRAGVKIARAIFAQAAFDGARGAERLPGPDVQSDDEIDAYIRETVRTVFHPCGTCRMGIDADSVVDPALKVRGIAGLRIADASVMPDVVGGNINAPVMMLADKGADIILGRPPLPAADV